MKKISNVSEKLKYVKEELAERDAKLTMKEMEVHGSQSPVYLLTFSQPALRHE